MTKKEEVKSVILEIKAEAHPVYSALERLRKSIIYAEKKLEEYKKSGGPSRFSSLCICEQTKRAEMMRISEQIKSAEMICRAKTSIEVMIEMADRLDAIV